MYIYGTARHAFLTVDELFELEIDQRIGSLLRGVYEESECDDTTMH